MRLKDRRKAWQKKSTAFKWALCGCITSDGARNLKRTSGANQLGGPERWICIGDLAKHGATPDTPLLIPAP